MKRKPAEGLTGAPLGDGAPPLVGVRLSPYGGKSFPPWDFGVSAAAFAAAPRQHKPPSEETVERQDSDEAQTKGKTRMVKFITIRGTRAPPRLSAPASLSVMPSASRLPLPHRFAQMADCACENGQPSSPSRIRFCPMRFYCVIISEVSIQRFRMR